MAKLAKKHSHISVNDFVATYKKECGLEQIPVKGDYLKPISHHIVNNTTCP